MELDKAQAYIQGLYDNHAPVKHTLDDGAYWYWSPCNGDHCISAYDYDIDETKDGYCYFYVEAAEILGLPLAPMEKSPPRVYKPSPMGDLLMKSYEAYIKQALTPYPITSEPIIFQKAKE